MDPKTRERIKTVRAETWRRRWRSIRIGAIAAACVLVAAGIVAAVRGISASLRGTELFALRTVRVIPPEFEPLIAASIELERGGSLLFLDAAAVREAVVRIRTVEKCTVRKRLPDTLEIDIVVRKAWMRLPGPAGEIFIDTAGVVVPPPENPGPYWMVRGIALSGETVGEQDEEKLPVLAEIEKWYNFFNIANAFTIAEADFSDPARIVLKDATRSVHIRSGDLRKQFSDLSAVLRACVRDATAWEYIDLRFDNPVLKKTDERTDRHGP